MGKFFYPTGVATGYSSAASYMAGLIGNVTGYPGVAAPPQPTGNDGFLQAMMDAILGGVGFQGSNFLTPAATGTTSTIYVDMPGAAMTFVPRVTRQYELHCDWQWFRSAGAGNGIFRIACDSANGNDWQIVPSSSNTNQGPYHAVLVTQLFAGVSTTIKLQWKVSAGTTAAEVSGLNPVNFYVRG